MTQSLMTTTRRRVVGQLGAGAQVALLLAVGLLVAGCPPVDDGGDGTTDGQPTGSINNLASNIRVSGEQSLTIVYDAGPDGADVRGFYIEVESTAPDASTIGAEVIFAENLPTGDDQTTALNTAPMPVGIYRVGLDITAGGATLRVFSVGTIQITTLPDPVFTLPNQDLIAQPGGNINVSATAGDPENAVQWRLFYIAKDERPSAAPDEYGTQIAAGAANVALATWFTAGVPLGEYEIGIFVTDSGQSIADTVASGNTDEINGPFFNEFIVTLTEDPPATLPPSVIVTQPSSNQNILVADPADPNDGNVLVAFEVTVFQGPPALQFVDVFYDFDGVADTGDEQIISASLPTTATNAVFRVASIEVGTTAFLGVTAQDGVSAPVTRYAGGTVRRASFDDTVLNLTSPAPGTVTELAPGDTLPVRWQLNAPEATGGETTVYFRRLDQQGVPLNSDLIPADIITSGLPLNQEQFSFAMDSSGRFQATVKVDIDGDPDPLIDSSGVVVVTTLPEIFWLGDLTAPGADLRGTIFGGFEPEDNAGAALAGGEDFNNDGNDDFIVVSRYAKPDGFGFNPNGIGIGEAYLIRGSSNLAGQSFNVNTVSSETLPGMVFTGVPIQSPTSSDLTHGIASVFISGDADDDGIGEIWFGMPFANFRVTSSRRTLEREGQFVHGGVVGVSSKNDRVRLDINNARIELDEVGMVFEFFDVAPEPRNRDTTVNVEEVDLCSTNTTWLGDFWRYYEGDCPTGEAQTELPFNGCVNIFNGLFGDASDSGGPDTLIEPRHGFSPVLANNFAAHQAFRPGGRLLCFDTAVTRDNPCPSCFPGDSPTCNGTCLPVEFDVEADSPDFVGHPVWEPLDLSDSANEYCSATIDGNLSFAIPGTWGPGTVDLPEPPEGVDCTLLQNVVDAAIQNPARILNIDNGFETPMVFSYQLNRQDGLARSPTFTGFYPDEYVADGAPVTNNPIQPFGMRIIGRPPTSGVLDGDHEEFSLFGTSITQVDDLMIISAPQRDAIDGFDGSGYLTPVEIEDAGVLYTHDNFAYWEGNGPLETATRIPPKPHMFLAGGQGVTGFIGALNTIPPGTTATRWDLAFDREFETVTPTPEIVGGAGENIETVVNVGDFNGDARTDFAVGSPLRSTSDGAVYVVFRRSPSLEGDFILEKLAVGTNDPVRLNGVLITGDAGAAEEFGRVLASGVDFNGDGIGDLIVGVPLANGGVGEVVIIFSQTGVVTPENGTTVEDLLVFRQGARITGSTLDLGSEFGFTVTNAGDVDGDLQDDLLISAPSATPRFDPDASDAIDELTDFGLDRNRDGIQDDVTGPFGRPDGFVTADDDLVHAGLVYVILSSADARTWSGPGGIFEIDIDQLGTAQLPGFIIVGRNGERIADNGVTIDGDYLGGGNAASTSQGGSSVKAPIPAVGGDRGRGVGLAAAGDVDNDGFGDFLLGAQLADPRVNPQTGEGIRNGGEAYLIFGGP